MALLDRPVDPLVEGDHGRIAADERLGAGDDGFASSVPRRYVVPNTCLANNACARLGPCGHYLTRRPCGTTHGKDAP